MSALKSTYKILPEYNLIIEIHKGILEVESYINFKIKLSQDSSFKASMNNFINFRNVEFNTTPADVQKFVNFIKNSAPTLGKRKVTLLTDTPNQVVNTTIYKTLVAGVSNDIEIFSTTNAALNWLLKVKDPKEILDIITTLEQNI